MVESILITRFGAVDEPLAAIVPSLVQLPVAEVINLLLNRTKAELIAQFFPIES